jgi:hypothetical protein
MTKEARKRLIIVCIVALILIGPLVLLSSPGMARLERMAVDNSGKEWAPTLQLRCATTYGWTLRRDKQRQAYETFLRVFTADPRRGYAKYMIAVCMERDHSCSKVQTRDAYEDFLYEYENDAAFQTLPEWRHYVNEAERALDRLAPH